MEDAITSQADQHRIAAEAAEGATLWEDAVREYEACLSLVAQSEDAAGQDEAALLTALGRCYYNLSEARTAWRTLRRAMSICEERGDAVGLARATIEIRRIWGPPDRQRAMAEEALRRLGDAEPHLQAYLLLGLRWSDNTALERALAIAEEHGFEDVLAVRKDMSAHKAMEDGRVDEALSLFRQAHDALVQQRRHEAAASTLRGAAFNLIEAGLLDQGYAFAEESADHALKTHFYFQAQLALMDMAGVAFARGDFALCEDILARAPTNSDFRGDLYRMWMAEARGDIDAALRLTVDPARGGGAPTAVGQIHAAAAGILFRAGKNGAAQQALRAWADVSRPQHDEAYYMEAPALVECLVALAGDVLVQQVYDALRARDSRAQLPARFATLQGRSLYPLRGAVATRLGLADEAARHYRDGIAWCSEQRCPADAAMCERALAALAK
jgi:tetratricopeptide (TPR) repeat protein